MHPAVALDARLWHEGMVSSCVSLLPPAQLERQSPTCPTASGWLRLFLLVCLLMGFDGLRVLGVLLLVSSSSPAASASIDAPAQHTCVVSCLVQRHTNTLTRSLVSFVIAQKGQHKTSWPMLLLLHPQKALT
jgi:hypothetical protein